MASTRSIRVRGSSGKFTSSKGFFTINTLGPALFQFDVVLVEGVLEVAEEFSNTLEQYAKTTAPWKDQSGDARAGLTAETRPSNKGVAIDLYHTVEYGLWLELKWGGRYAVILPTIEAKAGSFLSELRGLLDGIDFT